MRKRKAREGMRGISGNQGEQSENGLSPFLSSQRRLSDAGLHRSDSSVPQQPLTASLDWHCNGCYTPPGTMWPQKGLVSLSWRSKLLWRPHFLGKAESALKNATRLSHTSSWIWQRFLHKLICPPSPPHILKNIKGMEHGRSEKAMSPLWSQT